MEDALAVDVREGGEEGVEVRAGLNGRKCGCVVGGEKAGEIVGEEGEGEEEVPACYVVRVEEGDDCAMDGEAEKARFAVGVMGGGAGGGGGELDGHGYAVGERAAVDSREETGGMIGCGVGANTLGGEGGWGQPVVGCGRSWRGRRGWERQGRDSVFVALLIVVLWAS